MIWSGAFRAATISIHRLPSPSGRSHMRGKVSQRDIGEADSCCDGWGSTKSRRSRTGFSDPKLMAALAGLKTLHDVAVNLDQGIQRRPFAGHAAGIFRHPERQRDDLGAHILGELVAV